VPCVLASDEDIMRSTRQRWTSQTQANSRRNKACFAASQSLACSPGRLELRFSDRVSIEMFGTHHLAIERRGCCVLQSFGCWESQSRVQFPRRSHPQHSLCSSRNSRRAKSFSRSEPRTRVFRRDCKASLGSNDLNRKLDRQSRLVRYTHFEGRCSDPSDRSLLRPI